VLVVTFAPPSLRLGCRQQVRSHLGVVSKQQSMPGSIDSGAADSIIALPLL
jgi:hypothetical protein